MTSNHIIQIIQQYAASLAKIIADLTAITAIPPTRHDNQALDTTLRICNILAGNVGKNKNADEKKKLKGHNSESFEEHA